MTNIEQPISSAVRNFILTRIESVARLEALMLLRLSPDQRWEVSTLACRLYLGEQEAAKVLNGLLSSQLIVREGALFRYYPHKDEDRDLVERLAETYARSLVPVTRLIHEKSFAVQKFADAFKFRKGQIA